MTQQSNPREDFMAQPTSIAALKSAPAPQGQDELSRLLSGPVRAAFDPEAWHAMQERDNRLIVDNLLHGPQSGEFVYAFKVTNKLVVGTSVVGARQLASEYKGIRARIVATIEKRGALFIFRTFEPLTIDTRELHALADETDFYECVMQVDDTKTGNSIQVRKRESKVERNSQGGTYERPHFDTIAESKAYRNGVLGVLPQSVITEFEKRNLRAGLDALQPDVKKLAIDWLNAAKQNPVSEGKTIDQLREGALAFAAKNGIALDRGRLNALVYAEILGLGNSVKDGLDAFKGAALSLGVVAGQEPPSGGAAGGTNPPPAATGDAPRTEQQDPAGGPTVEDAIAAAKRGEDDVARDLANSIGGEAPDRVAAIIAQREAQQAQPPAEQRRARRARANISTE